jgi:hypothetical protein
MSSGSTRIALALAAVGAMALAASPAVAAKSDDKDSKPGKLKTASASATSATTGLTTATATCPGKSKVVGGGFIVAAATSNDILAVLESRRASTKAWRVSAYRTDSGGAGPALPVTAEAYCRTGLGKLKERVAGVTQSGVFAGSSPVASCPLGRAAVSGGFSITAPNTPNSLESILQESLMTGGVGWVTRGVSFTAAPASTTFTSYVYCQQKGEKAAKTVTGTGAVPTPVSSNGSADTAPCTGKRDAFAGGFQLPTLFSNALIFIFESRHSGKGWHIAGTRVSGTDPGSITALGYCS